MSSEQMSSSDPPAHPVLITIAVSTALFCVQLDYFAMNLAIPRMADDLDAAATDMQWVISAYMLAVGACLVPGGRLGDMFGRRKILIMGCALFGLASVACALAPSVGALVGARVVQGIGAAMIFPTSVSVLTNAFPAAQASRVIGMCYGIAGIGNAAGPLVGGLFAEQFSWRWIFWLNVPFAVVAIVLTVVAIAESRDFNAPRRLDIVGLALLTTGIGAFTLTFDRGPSWGWTSVATLGLGALAILALVTFVLAEGRTKNPLVDLSLLRDTRFTVLVVAGTVANVAYAVVIFGSTLNLQQARGLEPLAAGIVFLGPSAGAALAGPLSGRLASRQNPVVIMGGGCIAAGLTVGALAAVSSWPVYIAALTACGFILGLIYAFTTVATQSVVRKERAGEAAGITLTSLVTLAGVGIAVSASSLEVLQEHGMSIASAIDRVLLIFAAGLLASGSVVIASRHKSRERAAP